MVSGVEDIGQSGTAHTMHREDTLHHPAKTHDATVLQTCVTLATIRNIAYYTNFWSLLAFCWVATFVLTPFQNRFGSAFQWVLASTERVRKVSLFCVQARFTLDTGHDKHVCACAQGVMW
jgi:hypothetical protein